MKEAEVELKFRIQKYNIYRKEQKVQQRGLKRFRPALVYLLYV